MFPSILTGITSAMSCTTYGPISNDNDLSRVLLDASLSVQCYQPVHLAILLTVLLPSFVFFAVIAPLAVVLAMRKHYIAGTLLPHQPNFHPVACYRYGFLFLGYEQESYGWEVLVMIRKAAFVVTSGLLRKFLSIIIIQYLSVLFILRKRNVGGGWFPHIFVLLMPFFFWLTYCICVSFYCSHHFPPPLLKGPYGPVAQVVGASVILIFSLSPMHYLAY